MTIREDVELLRRFARCHWSPTGGVVGGMIADLINSRQAAARATLAEVLHAVVRLYNGDLNSAHGANIAELRGMLEDVPMTIEQRENVGDQIERLMVTADAPPLVEHTTCTKCGRTFTIDRCLPCGERHAEMAIECITDVIGIDNYQEAAQTVLASWRAIKTLHGIFNTTTAERLIAVAQGAHNSSNDGAWLLGIKRKWDAWSTNDPKARAQRRLIYILRALRESMDEPLADAIGETVDVLDHMLDSIPF